METVFRLKPITAGIRTAIFSGLFAGASLAAEPTLPVPDAAFVGYGRAEEHVVGNTLFVNQHSEKAILNWDSFNVPKGDTVQFVQPDGSAIVLNRIFDNSGSPAQILGHINANGEVYLYDQNGFEFSKDSTVDVNSLVVSTLNISDAVFKNSNIADAYDTNKAAALDNGNSKESLSTSITIDKGALLQAAKSGRIIVAAPTVENNGTVQTGAEGQILLVASQDKVYLQPHSTSYGAWNGLLVEVGSGGNVSNNGLLALRQGNITLAGFAVNQSGRINSTTSVNINGSVRLQAGEGLSTDANFAANGTSAEITALNTSRGAGAGNAATVTLAKGSQINISPDSDNSTSLDSAAKPQSIVDVSGLLADFQAGSVVRAPGAQVNIDVSDEISGKVFANDSRIYMDNQAIIDVSGLKGVKIAADRDVVPISVESFELRNSPLQLSGILKGQTVYVDTRQTTQIIDTSKAAANITRGIDERMTQGGQINFNSANGDVIVNSGAQLSVAGGSLAYQSGYIHTTSLINQMGQIVNISQANPNVKYTGIYGQITQTSAKWGTKQVWDAVDQASMQYMPAYTQGESAGGVSINAGALAWSGSLSAGVVSGAYQRGLSQTPEGGSFLVNLTGTNAANETQNAVFQSDAVNIALNAGCSTTLCSTSASLPSVIFDSSLTNQSGVQKFTLTTTQGSVNFAQGNTLNLANGASLSVSAAQITMDSQIRAAGGAVALTATGSNANGNVILGSNAGIDVSGRWINDQQALQANGAQENDPLYIQGGSVILNAANQVSVPQGASINADGGAWVNSNGALTAGGGGSIDIENSGANGDAMVLQGTLSAYGLQQDGSLTLGNNNIVIGQHEAGDPAGALTLGVSNGAFNFAQQLGFNTITLKGNVGSSTGNITVKSGVNLDLQSENRVLASHYLNQPTGASIQDFSSIALSPESSRPTPVLNLMGGDSTMTLQKNSSIAVDMSSASSQSAINLTTQGSIYADGALSAPGGQISMQINPVPADPYKPAQAIWVGADASLSVKGAARLNPTDGLGRVTGQVLNGGDISINVERGYAILQQGSTLDVSGASQSLSILQPGGDSGAPSAATLSDVASNAGNIKISAAQGAVLDGQLIGHAGSSSTLGGALEIDATNLTSPPDPTVQATFPTSPLTFEVAQSSQAILGSGAAFGASLDAQGVEGKFYLSADKVNNGGFADLTLYAPAADSSVNFNGGVNLSTTAQITLDAANMSWSAGNNSASDTVTLTSPYMVLGSSYNRNVSGASVQGGGDFTANASYIQLQGASLWSGFSSVNLNSAHDLRAVGELVNQQNFLGELSTAATLNLSASQIYPATLSNFTFSSTGSSGANGAINIKGANTDVSPLSAGGSLTFQAATIDQAGVVKAPLGSITLSASNTLTLEKNSLTSVSAAGLLIPFGVVQGGVNWLYPLTAGQNQIISTPPTKEILLQAPDIQQNTGSVVDLSGGGDLFGSEFKPVATDVADFFTPGSTGTSAYDGSFAVIPSLNSALAPYDPNFMSSWSDANGINYALGSEVHLSASQYLPAGDYTILPAYYALLPGAYLVTPQANTQDQTLTTYSASGLPIVSGYELLAGTSAQSARASGYQVESSVQVLENHPEYEVFCAGQCGDTLAQSETQLNAAGATTLAANMAAAYNYLLNQSLLTQNFFATQAAANNASTPLLPVDNGQISVAAQSSLSLNGTLITSSKGRGARMDISATNIEVVHNLSGAAAAPGVLQILDSNLASFKVDSLFLGGNRTTNEDSYALSAPAASGGNTLTLNSAIGWAVNDDISGPGIADGAYITSINGDTVTLNKPLTESLAAGTSITDLNPVLVDGATNAFVTAQNVSFDSNVTLTEPDLVVAAVNNITVDGVNNNAANGAIGPGAQLTASSSQGVNTGDTQYNLIGDSAFLRLSADNQVSINRVNYNGAGGATGDLSIAAGAVLTAEKSMALDGSQGVQLAGSIAAGGNASPPVGDVYINAGQENINIGDAALVNSLSNALNLSNDLLAGLNLNQLSLNTAGSVNFYGNVGSQQSPLTFNNLQINASALIGNGSTGQAVNLHAENFTLQGSSASSTPTAGVQSFNLEATKTITITGGNVGFSGFNSVTLTADNQFKVSGTSTLTIAATTHLNSGYFSTSNGADLNVNVTSGHALNVGRVGTLSNVSPDALGGALNLQADAINFNAYALLPAGNLTLSAQGNGANQDVAIGANADIDLGGRTVYYGTSVDYANGGNFTAKSANGVVYMAGGSSVNVASGGGSAAAGTLTFDAANQSVIIDSKAAINAAGGSASFDVNDFSHSYSQDASHETSSFDQLVQVLNQAGVTGELDFRVRNDAISAGAGDVINARTVNLTADQGSVTYAGQINADGLTGQYTLSAAADKGGDQLTVANVSGLEIGDSLSGAGLAANTVITGISGHTVTLSSALTGALSAGAAISDGSLWVANHSITSLDETQSNVVGVASIAGLTQGDVLSGAGLPVGTEISFLPNKQTTLNGVTDYWLVLSDTPTTALTAGAQFSDASSGASVTLAAHDNTWMPSNTITLDSVSGLQVGQHLVGAGLAENTTITGISGNTVTLSALPLASAGNSDGSVVQAAAKVAAVDAARVTQVDAGSVNIYAGGGITLAQGAVISAQSAWGKGGQVLLSSLTAPSAAGGVALDSGSSILVGGSSDVKGGQVTLRALRTGDGTDTPYGVNITNLAGTVSGYSSFTVEAVRQYGNQDIDIAGMPAGWIDNVIPQIQTDTAAYMAGASIAGLTAQYANLNFMPGVEIDYNGPLSLNNTWDLSSWRYNNGQVGDLVIRSTGGVTFNASLSDGFQSGNFTGAKSASGVQVVDQLMQGASWSYTLTAGSDLSSANPNATLTGAGNLTVGNADAVDANDPQVAIRTGTGNMHLNAGQDIVIRGNGTVYSAGQESSAQPFGNLTDSDVSTYFLVEYPINGGEISLHAAGDVIGAVSGTDYNNWLLALCCNPVSSTVTSIYQPTAWGVVLGYVPNSNTQIYNAGGPAFQENIGSFGGGNVTIKAGGNITNLELAMPSTGKPVGSTTTPIKSGVTTPHLKNFTSNVVDIEGGGVMTISAGGDIQGGSYYLGKGEASISAQGQVGAGANGAWSDGPQLYSGDTQFYVNANNGISLGGVADPMTGMQDLYLKTNYYPSSSSFFSYTDASGVAAKTIAGDINLNGGADITQVYPANLAATAFGGNIILNSALTMFPSSVGQLNLFADQSIYSANSLSIDTLLMSDYSVNASVGGLPTLLNPNPSGVLNNIGNFLGGNHASDASDTPLHVNDLKPVKVIAKQGDIKNIGFNLPKMAVIQAGQDISNINLSVQNIHNSDTTILDAGRDLIYPTQLSSFTGTIINNPNKIQVAGPGDVLVETGRNLDLGASSGLLTVGDKNGPLVNNVATTNSALITPYFVSSANLGTSANQLVLLNTTGLVVGQQLTSLSTGFTASITAIKGNTVTLSASPSAAIDSGSVFSVSDSASSYFLAGTARAGDTVLNLQSSSGLLVGEQLTGSGLADGTVITKISGNTVTLNTPLSAGIQSGALVLQSTKDAPGTYLADVNNGASITAVAGLQNSSTGQFTLGQSAAKGSEQLTLTNVFGLQAGDVLSGSGLAAGSVITKISGNTVTLNTALTGDIAKGGLISDSTLFGSSQFSGKQDFVDFMNSDLSLQAYIAQLIKNEAQLASNGASSQELNIYKSTIAQYQALLPEFEQAKTAATALIVNFMQQTPGYVYKNDAQTVSDFRALSNDQIQPLAMQLNNLLLPLLYQEILINGSASASDKALGNSLGYGAIGAMFPGSAWQGDMAMYFSTLQTVSGGNINLLTPGGGVDTGLAVAVGFSGLTKGANDLGVIADGQGSVNAVVNNDFTVNTSRVFTLDGGDIMIWSSNGNINAGKGAKTALVAPPVVGVYVNGDLTYQQQPGVSGSGIRTEGASPGNVSLFAPNGVVNAAEAGIAGKNVTISATAVLGAQNISFSGVGTGVPQASTSSLAAGLTGASNLGASVSQVAQSAMEDESSGKSNSKTNANLSLLTVELIGYGD